MLNSICLFCPNSLQLYGDFLGVFNLFEMVEYIHMRRAKLLVTEKEPGQLLQSVGFDIA